MINKPSKAAARKKRRKRIRGSLSGTAFRPRLAVFRSNKNIYVQAIDDSAGHTIASASTMDKAVADALGADASKSDVAAATAVGRAIAERLTAKGVAEAVFDRGGYIYHGKVKALAEAAREAGLKF